MRSPSRACPAPAGPATGPFRRRRSTHSRLVVSANPTIPKASSSRCDASIPTSIRPAIVAAMIPVATFAALIVVRAMLPALGRTAAGRAFYVHALNGFYFGAIADRLVDRVARIFGLREVQGA